MSEYEGGGQMGGQEFVKRDEFNRLDERVSRLDIRYSRLEVRTDHIEDKLDKIDSNTTWILRIIIGVITAALLGLIII